MSRSESGPSPPEVQRSPMGSLGPDSDDFSSDEHAPGERLEEESTPRRVVAIDVAREVIARFSGTLNQNELPERQPEIVFDHRPRSRDDEDE